MERVLAARRRVGRGRGGVDSNRTQPAACPIYGICYGNQIMAHALGGTVERAREPEIGWHQVVSDVPEVIAEGPWMQWHYDVVTVPPTAQELARSAVGPQAWRMGRSFCTQFHPEATETMIRRWASSEGGGAELLKYGIKPDQLIEDDTTQRRRQPARRRPPRRLVPRSRRRLRLTYRRLGHSDVIASSSSRS